MMDYLLGNWCGKWHFVPRVLPFNWWWLQQVVASWGVGVEEPAGCGWGAGAGAVSQPGTPLARLLYLFLKLEESVRLVQAKLAL